MRTSELTDADLDWAVSQIEGKYRYYSTYWDAAGPIIEREGISLDKVSETTWIAFRREGPVFSEEYGPAPLIAAMRCFVASKLGDEVEIPNELTGDNK